MRSIHHSQEIDHFQPISLDYPGPNNSYGRSFICKLGRHIVAISGDSCVNAFSNTPTWIHHCFNAVAFTDIFILQIWTCNLFRFYFLALLLSSGDGVEIINNFIISLRYLQMIGRWIDIQRWGTKLMKRVWTIKWSVSYIDTKIVCSYC